MSENMQFSEEHREAIIRDEQIQIVAVKTALVKSREIIFRSAQESAANP
jgi:hypothetical protein